MSLIVTWSDEKVTAALEVHAADSPMEFQRWRMRESIKRQNGQYTGEVSLLHMYAWPEMAVALTGEITIRYEPPEVKEGDSLERHLILDRAHVLPFDVYLDLPDPLIIEIEDALYRLNPQWMVRAAETADSEKKGQTSSTGD